MKQYKNKGQAIDLINKIVDDDKIRTDLLFIIENWTSFNNERFTVNRLSETFLKKGKRYSELKMYQHSKQFATVGVELLY